MSSPCPATAFTDHTAVPACPAVNNDSMNENNTSTAAANCNSSKTIGYQYQGSLFNNLIGTGKYFTTIGFNLVQISTFLGFRLAQFGINFAADQITDVAVGEVLSLTNIINGIRSTVTAAEAVTLTGLFISHAVSIASLRLTDHVLDQSGIAEASEVFLWQQVEHLTPVQLKEYQHAVGLIVNMVDRFKGPINERGMSLKQCRLYMVQYALTQQQQSSSLPSGRLPMMHAASTTTGANPIPVGPHHNLNDTRTSVLRMGSERGMTSGSSSSSANMHLHGQDYNHYHPAPAAMRHKRQTQCMVRSMGFAAIAYGDLILKFLEFVPKYGLQGMYADMFEHLTPGVTVADITHHSNDSNGNGSSRFNCIGAAVGGVDVDVTDTDSGNSSPSGSNCDNASPRPHHHQHLHLHQQHGHQQKPHQSLYCPNYIVLVDHKHRDIVVCVRGSISVADIMTDLVCESVELHGLFDMGEKREQQQKHTVEVPQKQQEHELSSAPIGTASCSVRNEVTCSKLSFDQYKPSVDGNHKINSDNNNNNNINNSSYCSSSSGTSTNSSSPQSTTTPPHFSEYIAPGSTTDPSVYAHSGMFYAAQNLDRLLRYEIVRLLQRPEHSGYGVLLSGHSLGAGVAALLTLLWIRLPAFASTAVHCVAYSPPCILSLGAARHVRTCAAITSVVINDDVVARLSLGSCLDLRDSLIRLHDTTSSSSNNSDTATAASSASMSTNNSSRHHQYHKLYPPGQLIHIVDRDLWNRQYNDNSRKSDSSDSSDSQTPYLHYKDTVTGTYQPLPVITITPSLVAYYADQCTFSEMQLSSTMCCDHLPHICLQKCKEVFNSQQE